MMLGAPRRQRIETLAYTQQFSLSYLDTMIVADIDQPDEYLPVWCSDQPEYLISHQWSSF